MSKFLLIVLAAVAVIWWWKRERPAAARPPAPAPAPTGGAPQDMVKCTGCDLHLPRADVLVGIDGRPYCSAEHRRLGTGV